MNSFFFFVRETSQNTVTLNPTPTKTFSHEEREYIKALLKAEGLTVSNTGKASVSIIDGVSDLSSPDYDLVKLVENIVPKAMTKAELKSISTNKKQKDLDKKKREAQAKLFKEEPAAVEWCFSIFGETFSNKYNLAKLVLFISNRTESFEGLANWKWEDGLRKIDAVKDNEDGTFTILFDKIKEAFANS
ncbi:hypothetical protein [Photobacterium kishitanii]|uniref:Uncharacterized protein n=1 Tax=Photobacterium kishitanii TaxID=318456 RepID=A0A2T3KLG6_9GAMM|nr:hypothetical protein [Photobacterium kishitanii]PSV00490.1 hypothetical protein C9J27_04980 [Photobacterium kishitanii]